MERKFYDMWLPILEDFTRNYYMFEERVRDWYPSGRNEIIVILDDGCKLRYDWLSKTYYEITNTKYSDPCEDEKTWRTNFAERLSLKIKNTCYTQERLAVETGISMVTINKYTKGRAIPSAYNLMKIARALKCSITELTEPPID